jgi:Circularly permutated YpsA SLOG family
MTLEKIISGGQTRVDRGALDVALEVPFPCGGWCPADRAAEDGPIPARYPVTPLLRGGYRERTRQNVLDSDGTAILYLTTLAGGTLLTLNFCIRAGKPYCLIDAAQANPRRGRLQSHDSSTRTRYRALNVAGPRLSGWPQGYEATQRTLRALLRG